MPIPRALALIGLIPLACTGSANDKAPKTAAAPSCAAPGASVIGTAVTNYIKIAQPTPMRFLVAVGTDSALPEGGLTALQGKGPTFLFPGDPNLQKQVRANLKEKGDWPTLLVVYRGTQTAATTATVRLGGRFVGGKDDGTVTPPRALNFVCDSTGWRFTTATEERST
jgi:hypothetical protein